MTPIPPALRKKMSEDPYYTRCARAQDDCSGRITWEHAWIYGSRQIQEAWAIIPLCWHHHLGTGLDKHENKLISLLRASPENLEKYPKKNWEQELKTLIYTKENANRSI